MRGEIDLVLTLRSFPLLLLLGNKGLFATSQPFSNEGSGERRHQSRKSHAVLFARQAVYINPTLPRAREVNGPRLSLERVEYVTGGGFIHLVQEHPEYQCLGRYLCSRLRSHSLPRAPAPVLGGSPYLPLSTPLGAPGTAVAAPTP